MKFREITLADKERIERYTHNSSRRSCDNSFANVFCWQSTYRSAWCEVDDFLIIRFWFDGEGGQKLGYMQPIGHNDSLDFSHLIPLMAEDAERHGSRLRIIGLGKEACRILSMSHKDKFALYSDPNYEDYIYMRESLATLAGKRLQPKRNHINQLIKRYGTYEYRALTHDIFDDCRILDCKWRHDNGQECDNSSPERVAIERAFEHFEELELIGGALYIEGRIVAFSYGSRINCDTFCVHVEKATREYTGCYSLINKLLAESLPEEFKYINREEDLGIEGLRRAKQSYYPTFKEEKYAAIYLHQDEIECRRLWREVFGDEESFIDEFLTNHYSRNRVFHICDPEQRYISMVHYAPFECAIGRVAYIYGIATEPQHRGKGYATSLIKHTLQTIHNEGYTAALLIPSEESLKSYYATFGFCDANIELTFDSYNSFDWGTGDTTKDRAMIYHITDDTSSNHKSLTLTR